MEQTIERANQELNRLLKGERFRVSIPRKDDDSDALLGDALAAALEILRRFEWLEVEMRVLKASYEEANDTAERFIGHANAIWNAAFPDDIDGWEYGAQLERCVTDKIRELREMARQGD